jgi:ubiquinol-cytochrome c reductase cytochrome b subunit
MIKRLFDWFDERLGAASFARRSLRKVFPDHWSFMLGEIALYCFIILVLTGIFLSLFYIPDIATTTYHGPYRPLQGQSMTVAYRSVLRLSFEVRAGLVFRQIHHWAALVMIGAVAAHAARIFFTGAFRKPRELNWIFGVTLLLLTLFIGFAGYSLPDDLLSGTGLRIGYSVVLSVPVVGTWLAFLLFGGEYPAPDLLHRFFVIHVFLLPAAIAAVIAAHLAIVWRQKHTHFPGDGRTETNIQGERLWPRYALKSAGLFFIIAAVVSLLGGLAQINPIWLYGPYNAHIVSGGSQPDWYFGWLEGALRLFPNYEIRFFGFDIPNVFYPGVLLPGVVFTAMFVWPWIERAITGDRAIHDLLNFPREVPWRTALGLGVITFMIVLTLAGGNDIIASQLGVSVETVTLSLRVAVVALPLLVVGIAYRWAAELNRRRIHPLLEPKITEVRRTATGGFEAVEVGADRGEDLSPRP